MVLMDLWTWTYGLGIQPGSVGEPQNSTVLPQRARNGLTTGKSIFHNSQTTEINHQ